MLKDVLQCNLDVVFCGTAKGTLSVMKGFYYAAKGNQFYHILHKAGFTSNLLIPAECYKINQYSIGLIDLVHNQHGNDNEIDETNYDVDTFSNKIKIFKPKIVAFNGKKAAAFALGYQGKTKHVNYGEQNQMIGESKLFVLPSTSGSARRFWDESHWFELKKCYG
ncbi:mismatch-specific DNA-glycosylase [Chryseobacterium aureum]|uniref:mismatch-specific DNA-glycosylase n=1 Tax=Chryseobacterium aureum TaxID=2497456 RepID=UPI000F895430|nr:mismatch-specific DNA-glycosylase [Chryseobacterium aureum]